MKTKFQSVQKDPTPLDSAHQVGFLTLGTSFMGFASALTFVPGKEIYAVVFGLLAVACFVLREKFKK